MPLKLAQVRRPAIVLAILLGALAAWAAADWYRTVPPDALAKAHYVGRQSCVYCHQAESQAWTGSHHDRAMELASDETVLGDFSGAVFHRFDETTRFYRDGKKFMVNAEGPDGQNHDYEVKYTFGIDPLQQYMVEFPGGRVQVLRVSWDVAKHKWFYVAPPDAEEERIKSDDPLHWTGMAQNWNTMCAECHTTDFHKNFDLATNAYHSEYAEINVSCETCHGPGSVHVGLAEGHSLFWDRRVGYGLTNLLKGAPTERQLDTCAPCHSRRTAIHADYRAGGAYLDSYTPALLGGGLYYPDGQIRDEVYGYASFMQSKMFHKGVKCSDCHNPHSLKLKYEGNRLCAQCHQPGKYDTPAHNHHDKAEPGAAETQCVTCHMPTHVYMEIDARHDHSIRVPRPDLSAKLGTPNACNQCHTKQSEDANWAAAAIVRWFGDKRPDDPHYGVALAAELGGGKEAVEQVQAMIKRPTTPVIVRATAIEGLQNFQSPESERLRREALADSSPLVRAAAVRSLSDESKGNLVRDMAPKLKDPVRSVRLAAANRLVDAAGELAGTEFHGALEDAVKEYRAAQDIYLERADSHLNLANLSMKLGDLKTAVAELRLAIRQEPYRTDPRGELARILEQISGDPSQAQLWAELGGDPQEIVKLRREEADLLERDEGLLPGNPQPHYRRGMLLYLLGKTADARDEMIQACNLAPNDYKSWTALALLAQQRREWDLAKRALFHMSKLRPDAQDWRDIAIQVRDAINAEGASGQNGAGKEKSSGGEQDNAPRSNESRPSTETPPPQ